MDYRDSVEELRQIAEYYRARRFLRAAGTASILFGVLATALGGLMLMVNPINLILMLIGIGLLAEGLWNVALPTAAGVIVDGFMLLIVGLWNMFVTIANVLVGAEARGFWLVLGMIQIGWGIYRFTSYGRFYKAFQEKPEPEQMARMDALIKRLKKTKASEAPDIIGFRTKSFWKNQQEWKGQLGDSVALFIDKRGYDIQVATRDDVLIRESGKVLIGKALKASIRIGDQWYQGLINPESYAKYKRWKAAGDALEVVRAVEEEPEPGDEGFYEKRVP